MATRKSTARPNLLVSMPLHAIMDETEESYNKSRLISKARLLEPRGSFTATHFAAVQALYSAPHPPSTLVVLSL